MIRNLPLMRDRHRIEYFYSVYILDLCFVMPAFFIAAVLSLRGLPFGILMAPPFCHLCLLHADVRNSTDGDAPVSMSRTFGAA